MNFLSMFSNTLEVSVSVVGRLLPHLKILSFGLSDNVCMLRYGYYNKKDIIIKIQLIKNDQHNIPK